MKINYSIPSILFILNFPLIIVGSFLPLFIRSSSKNSIIVQKTTNVFELILICYYGLIFAYAIYINIKPSKNRTIQKNKALSLTLIFWFIFANVDRQLLEYGITTRPFEFKYTMGIGSLLILIGIALLFISLPFYLSSENNLNNRGG